MDTGKQPPPFCPAFKRSEKYYLGLKWFFYYLWYTPSTFHKTKFNFVIPDTVVYRASEPVMWYFSCVDGTIKVKRDIKTQLYGKEKLKQSKKMKVCTVYQYNSEETIVNIIQSVKRLFKPSFKCKTPPTLESKSSHYTIKCQWSPHLLVLEKHSNLNQFNDENLSFLERVVTFEDKQAGLTKIEPVVSSTIITDVKVACKLIACQFKINGFRLKSAVYYFRINTSNNLCLLFATDISTEGLDSNMRTRVSWSVKEPKRKFMKEAPSYEIEESEYMGVSTLKELK